MKYITKICLNCQEPFECSLKEHNRGNGKFCSQSCSSKYNRPKPKEPNMTCIVCQKPMYKSPSKLKNSRHGYHFCSRKCKELAQSPTSGYTIEAIMPDHYGDGLYSYGRRARSNKPLVCEACGYNEYPEILEVHHKDRNRRNNILENLKILCPNCHQVEHFLTKSGRFNGGPTR